MRWWIWLVIGGGCRDLTSGDAGDAQPGTAAARLAPPVGVAVVSATTGLGEVRYTDCDGVEVIGPGGAMVDLGAGTAFALEPGAWCQIRAGLAQPLVASGITQLGIGWQLDLTGVVIELGDGETSFQVLEERPYLLELGDPGWFRAADLAVEDTAVVAVTVDAAHVAHGALVSAVSRRSALLVDLDADGVVDETERVNAVVAAGPDRGLP